MTRKTCLGSGGSVGLQNDGKVICPVCTQKMEPIVVHKTVGLVPPHYPYLMQTGVIDVEGEDLESFKDATARFSFGMSRAEARDKGICIAGHPYTPTTEAEKEEYERSALCLHHLEQFSRGRE